MAELSDRPIRIATRASRLALWQAEHVADLLRSAAPEVQVELVHVSTLGDRDLSGPLSGLGAFGVFTREVQKVVLDGQADLTVHSLKDLPTDRVEGLILAGVPVRGPTADALVLPQSADSRTGNDLVSSWETLPAGARVGTGSLRRRAQLLHRRPDFELHEVRGNVETRLRKLDEGNYEALVLAVAGLERLGLEARISQKLEPPLMFPAVGQGALGLECRTDDEALRQILESITDADTLSAVSAERSLLADLRAGCHAPLGVWARQEGDELILDAVVLSPDGRGRIVASERGSRERPVELGIHVASRLREQGAERMIAAARD